MHELTLINLRLKKRLRKEKLLERKLAEIYAAEEEMFLPYCTSEKNPEEQSTEITKVGYPKNERFFDSKGPKVNVFLKEVKDSKEMKDLMKGTLKITHITTIKPPKIIINKDLYIIT
ncbi:hypothetical protein TSAR_005695 [Trichomalopsis sarcophagae]|uniref:Uncharacterized protein n=1 Tax=Trichomalopsis sarcophagae TaxID=543379 RepID=A0A232FI31_9HYME|nr:hypothetical protein TSAR_005695 [Trichomalopsis sarcophagae]